jgi:hypothetical protein
MPYPLPLPHRCYFRRRHERYFHVFRHIFSPALLTAATLPDIFAIDY